MRLEKRLGLLTPSKCGRYLVPALLIFLSIFIAPVSTAQMGSVEFQNVRSVNGDAIPNWRIEAFEAFDGSYAGITITDFEGNATIDLPAGDYYFEIVSEYSDGSVTTNYYPNAFCIEDVTYPCNGGLEFVTVVQDESLVVEDFEIQELPKVTMQFEDRDTGEPLSGVSIRIYDENRNGISKYWQESRQVPGQYFAYFQRPGQYVFSARKLGYELLLSGNISCGRGLGVDCALQDALLQTIALNDNKSSVWQMTPFVEASNAVQHIGLVNKNTGLPFPYHPDHEFVFFDTLTLEPIDAGFDAPFAGGTFQQLPLKTGSYYVLTMHPRAGYFAYPDAVCTAFDPSTCDASMQAVVVTDTSPEEILIEVTYNQGIQGVVRDRVTHQPLSGLMLDIWEAQGDGYYTSVITDSDGTFQMYAPFGRYTISSSVLAENAGYEDAYQDGTPCHLGPAFLYRCDFSPIDLISITPESRLAEVEIYLERRPQ